MLVQRLNSHYNESNSWVGESPERRSAQVNCSAEVFCRAAICHRDNHRLSPSGNDEFGAEGIVPASARERVRIKPLPVRHYLAPVFFAVPRGNPARSTGMRSCGGLNQR